MSSFKRRSFLCWQNWTMFMHLIRARNQLRHTPRTVIIMELGRLFQALRTAAHRGYNSEI